MRTLQGVTWTVRTGYRGGVPHSRRSFIALSQAAIAPLFLTNEQDGEAKRVRTVQLISLNSLQEVRDLPQVKTGAPIIAVVLGRVAPHDGGGGLFLYDPTGIGVDDSRTVISQSTKMGLWRRLTDGSIYDYSGVAAARDAHWGNDLETLEIPDGEHIIKAKLELAKDHWACVTSGGNARIRHVGKGVAVSLSGPSDNSNYGTYRGTLGGERPLIIEGNAGTTRLLDVDNFHQGVINVDLRNGQVGVHVSDSLNNISSAGAVLTRFKVRVSQGNGRAFSTIQSSGFYASKIFGCQCELLIEHCGNNGKFGVHIEASAANTFYGASEGNSSGGVLVASDSYRNTFIGFFCEENGTGYDFDVQGDFNRLINCTGVSRRGNRISGHYNAIDGGKFNNLVITSDATFTVVSGVDFDDSFTDESTTTTVRNCRINGAPMPDYAPRRSGALALGPRIASYAASDPSFQAPVCYRSADGLCQIAGSLAAIGAISIGDTIAVIPAGYRPSARIMFTAVNVSTNSSICLTADAAGNLQTRTAIGKGNVFGLLSPPFTGS